MRFCLTFATLVALTVPLPTPAQASQPPVEASAEARLAETPPNFDTLGVSTELESNDFSRVQAEALTRGLVRATAHLSTRADIALLDARFAGIESGLTALRWVVVVMIGATGLVFTIVNRRKP